LTGFRTVDPMIRNKLLWDNTPMSMSARMVHRERDGVFDNMIMKKSLGFSPLSALSPYDIEINKAYDIKSCEFDIYGNKIFNKTYGDVDCYGSRSYPRSYVDIDCYGNKVILNKTGLGLSGVDVDCYGNRVGLGLLNKAVYGGYGGYGTGYGVDIDCFGNKILKTPFGYTTTTTGLGGVDIDCFGNKLFNKSIDVDVYGNRVLVNKFHDVDVYGNKLWNKAIDVDVYGNKYIKEISPFVGMNKVLLRSPHDAMGLMGTGMGMGMGMGVSPLSAWRTGSSLALQSQLHSSPFVPFSDIAYFPWRAGAGTGLDTIIPLQNQQAPWIIGEPTHRGDAVETIMFYKHQKQVTFQQIAQCLGRSETWTCAALLGQATLSPLEAETLCDFLSVADPKIRHNLKIILTQPPLRGGFDSTVDPVICRFYEILQAYGTSLKTLIHEKFGDGAMSAVDVTVDLDKEKRADGEYIKITLNGKFLPYIAKKW